MRQNTQQPVVVPQEGFIYTEVVAGSPRVVPPVILDRAAGVDFPPELLSEAVGVLHIRSVYDIDGVDQAPGGIAAVRNPANAAYATRPARFLRIEKAVSQPDDDTRDIDEHRVRSEPRARHARHPRLRADRAGRLGQGESAGERGVQHQRARRARPPPATACSAAATRTGCRSCPASSSSATAATTRPRNPPRAHGRAGLTASVNAGAPTTGSPFPNTNAALFADVGETMAEVRNRVMCSGACEPSVDLAFEDYWPATPATTPSVDACYSRRARRACCPTLPIRASVSFV